MLAELDLDELFRAAEESEGKRTTVVQPPQHARPLAPPPLLVDLVGAHCFGSPSSANVLYASPLDSTNRIYPFALSLRTLLIQRGFIQPDFRPFTLHATLLKGQNLDVRSLLTHLEDFEWARDVEMDWVASCEMGVERVVAEKTGRVVEEWYREATRRQVRGQGQSRTVRTRLLVTPHWS